VDARVLCLKRPAWEAAWRHLRSVAPAEGVGLFVGRSGCGEEAWPLPNVHPYPEVGYRAEPGALLAALRRADERGLEVVALFHSHPTGLARPSATDRREAYWRVPYVIFGLAEGRARAYLLPEGREIPIEVTP